MGEVITRYEYGKNRFGQPENFTEFEEDGTMRMEGAATVYRDINISGSTLVPLGVSAPDGINFIDANLKAYAFDGGTTTEILFGSLEMQHDYKEGSDIEIHVHWAPTTNGAGAVVWQIYYSWTNDGDTWAAGTLKTANPTAAGGTAWVNKYTSIATISGTGKKINSQLSFKIFRDPTATGDDYADDAALIQLGIHYEVNTIGSRTQRAK